MNSNPENTATEQHPETPVDETSQTESAVEEVDAANVPSSETDEASAEPKENTSDAEEVISGEAGEAPADAEEAPQVAEGETQPDPDGNGEPVASDEADVDGAPLEMVEQLEYVKVTGGGKRKADPDDNVDLQLASVSEARSVIEGLLFTSNEPLSVQRLSKLMNNLHPKTIRGLLFELQNEYDNRPGALQILEIAGGFQMATRAHLGDWMFRMHRHKRRSALSPATLETLAIVAYKQPITKGEVEAIRGVESSGTMRTLQDLNLVDASGRREVVGRPQLFITTDQFLKSFGLKSLADLPSIAELRHLFASQQKLQASVAAAPVAETEEGDQHAEMPEGAEADLVAVENAEPEAQADSSESDAEVNEHEINAGESAARVTDEVLAEDVEESAAEEVTSDDAESGEELNPDLEESDETTGEPQAT